MFKMKVMYILAITFSLVLGISIISFLILLFLEPTLFIYYGRGAFSFLFVNFLFIAGLYTISSGFIIYREIMAEKENALGTERYLKNQMELKLLSSRINPHFLFNTLNMILSLLKQPEKAEIAILNLSDLLRENLDQSDKLSIPVSQELESVRKYLEIQKMRFGEKLTFEIIGTAEFPVPPFIIQPLVENSIKHNMQRVSHLSISLQVARKKDCATITIIDSEKAIEPSMLNRGHGLTITQKRVEANHGTFVVAHGGIEISFKL
jgi:LytS/YehU family sensor histidine kinase